MTSTTTLPSLEPLLHKSIFNQHLQAFKQLRIFSPDVEILNQLYEQLLNPVNIVYVFLPFILAKVIFHIEFLALSHFLLDKSKNVLTGSSRADNDSELSAVHLHNEKTKAKKKSLLQYIKQPVTLLSRFPMFLFVLDVTSILLHAIGIGYHIKNEWASTISKVLFCFIMASFSTKIKDFFVQRILRPYLSSQSQSSSSSHSPSSPQPTSAAAGVVMSTTPPLVPDDIDSNPHPDVIQHHIPHLRDAVQDSVIDELTSVVIWICMGLFCIQLLPVSTSGVIVGSVFTVGGVGTASFILALRSTFENLIGGLLLRLQDKFHVGEVITIYSSGDGGGGESLGGLGSLFGLSDASGGGGVSSVSGGECTVEGINRLYTRLRKNDNSLLIVPNSIFSQGQFVNWSRTNYRLFKTAFIIPDTQFKSNSMNIKDKNIKNSSNNKNSNNNNTVSDNTEMLKSLIKNVKTRLKLLPQIETKNRDLIVAATGFQNNNIIIEIEVHINSRHDIECSAIKTEIINIIHSCIYSPSSW